jgi:hypothetical protein
MKKTKPNYYKEVLEVLLELKVLYPNQTLGQHLATALEDYQDLWGVPDSEILYCLQKYQATLEYNSVPRETSDKELEKIVKEGMNLPSANELLGGY